MNHANKAHILPLVKISGHPVFHGPTSNAFYFFRREIQKLDDPSFYSDGPVLFCYGPLVEAASKMSRKEKGEMLVFLQKGWYRICDKSSWSLPWSLADIELAEKACYGGLTLLDAMREKLESGYRWHVKSGGCTEQGQAMKDSVEAFYSSVEEEIKDVWLRLQEGKRLIFTLTAPPLASIDRERTHD